MCPPRPRRGERGREQRVWNRAVRAHFSAFLWSSRSADTDRREGGVQAQVWAVSSHWWPGCEVKESLQVGEGSGLLQNLKRNLLTFPFCLKLILATARTWKRTFYLQKRLPPPPQSS